MRNLRLTECKLGCLLEMGCAMMMSVALNEEFDVCCPILDSYDRGWSSEIDDIPRRLVFSLFAIFTDISTNIPTSSPFQFQRELPAPFWSRAISVHRGCFRYFQELHWRVGAKKHAELDSSVNAGRQDPICFDRGISNLYSIEASKKLVGGQMK